MNKALQWIGVVALVVVCLALGFFVGRGARPQPPVVQTDTLVVRDTIREAFPVPSSVAPAGYELAPVGTLAELRAQVDSLASAAHDTTEIYVPVQIERAEFVKPDYHLIISGWHPRVELIEVFAKTETIINYIDRPVPADRPVPYRWALSAVVDAQAMPGCYQARAGLLYERQVSGLLRWRAGGGYSVGNLGRGPYIETGLELTILHNRK